MIKALVILTLAGLSFLQGPLSDGMKSVGEIPSDYYNNMCIIPEGMGVKEWLTAAEWVKPYELNSWDCSEMSAYTEWVLENCGYESMIRLQQIDDYRDHAFVMVRIDGEWKAYESVTREFMSYKLSLIYTIEYPTIYDLFQHLTPTRFYFEYGWWLREGAGVLSHDTSSNCGEPTGVAPNPISPPVAGFIKANMEAIAAAKIRGSFLGDVPYKPPLPPPHHYEFGGIALNPFAYEFCPERYRPRLVPNPSISPTPEPRRVSVPSPSEDPTPEPTPIPEPTPEPTPDPWTCPVIGDCTKKEYKDICLGSCKSVGLTGCGKICKDCWE